MEDIIGRWMFIWSETEKIEKSNEFITTKLIKILGLRGYLVTDEYIDGTELIEVITIDNKIKMMFSHSSYECYLDYKGKKIKVPYKNVMDIVSFVNFAELLYSTNSENKEENYGKNK